MWAQEPKTKVCNCLFVIYAISHLHHSPRNLTDYNGIIFTAVQTGLFLCSSKGLQATTFKTNAERQHLQKSLWAGRCPTYGLWNLLLGSIGRNSCSLPEKALKATTFILLLREYGRAVFYASFKDFRHIYSALNRKKYRGSQFTEWCLFLMNERVKLSTLHSKYVGGKQEIKLLKTF